MEQAASAFVSAVQRRMGHVLSTDGEVLAEASRRLCLSGGKHFRPRLLLLLGKAAGARPADLEDAAATAELIHGASLLHDDVVDEGRQRRGQQTANARWGNATAVLAGDWLLSTAFALLEPYGMEVTFEAIAVLREMSKAASDELEARGKVDLEPKAWRAIAEGKTGALFGWCGKAAARIARRDDLAWPFWRFGRRLGVAFQLADDLKDVWGGEPGKDRFSDLRNKNVSMPILLAVGRDPALRAEISQAWARPEVDAAEAARLGGRLVACGADREAADLLAREVSQAVEVLGPLAAMPFCDELVKMASDLAPESFAGGKA